MERQGLEVELGVEKAGLRSAEGRVMADRSFRGFALALLVLCLCSGAPPCLLLHGNGRAVFRGSVGRLRGPAWAELCEEPCEAGLLLRVFF